MSSKVMDGDEVNAFLADQGCLGCGEEMNGTEQGVGDNGMQPLSSSNAALAALSGPGAVCEGYEQNHGGHSYMPSPPHPAHRPAVNPETLQAAAAAAAGAYPAPPMSTTTGSRDDYVNPVGQQQYAHGQNADDEHVPPRRAKLVRFLTPQQLQAMENQSLSSQDLTAEDELVMRAKLSPGERDQRGAEETDPQNAYASDLFGKHQLLQQQPQHYTPSRREIEHAHDEGVSADHIDRDYGDAHSDWGANVGGGAPPDAVPYTGEEQHGAINVDMGGGGWSSSAGAMHGDGVVPTPHSGPATNAMMNQMAPPPPRRLDEGDHIEHSQHMQSFCSGPVDAGKETGNRNGNGSDQSVDPVEDELDAKERRNAKMKKDMSKAKKAKKIMKLLNSPEARMAGGRKGCGGESKY